jgi:LEA14-like dessication related protein
MPLYFPYYHPMRLWFAPFWGLILCFLSCATGEGSPAAVPQDTPRVSLSFDRIEALDPDHIVLHFVLAVENSRSAGASVDLRGGRVVLNGRDPGGRVRMASEGTEVPACASARFPVRLDLDMSALPGDADEYEAELLLDPVFIYDSGEKAETHAGAGVVFPRIRAPEFTIASIAIIRAELINTRFKVKLRIGNPNPFPVELSSFTYELYGAGRFWAGGEERDLMRIPPKGSAEAELFLVMNFINMPRELLDQVIAMRQVGYRFAGEAAVGTGIEYLPQFRMSFDRSGNSPVAE